MYQHWASSCWHLILIILMEKNMQLLKRATFFVHQHKLILPDFLVLPVMWYHSNSWTLNVSPLFCGHHNNIHPDVEGKGLVCQWQQFEWWLIIRSFVELFVCSCWGLGVDSLGQLQHHCYTSGEQMNWYWEKYSI